MNSDDNTERRLQCPTAPKVLDLAEPRDAQFVVASLVSSGTWRTPLCSKKCVDRFRARRETDRNWVGWLQIAFDLLP
jgi:hypothetical protein